MANKQEKTIKASEINQNIYCYKYKKNHKEYMLK